LAACHDEPTGPAASNDVALGAKPVGEANTTVAWNEISRELVMKDSTGAGPAIRVYTLVSVAQYNAVIAAEAAHAGSGAPSVPAAVAGASAAVLTYLYPDEAEFLEGKVAELDPRRASHETGENFASGEEIGRAVAAQVIEYAKGDLFLAPFTGTVPVCPGCWLPSSMPPAGGALGQAKTYFLESGGQFRPPPPPVFGSADFVANLAELREIAQTRTAEQDSIAKFWAFPTGTVTPQGHWNERTSQLILDNGLGERSAAHALALMNIAVYDVIIASQEAKFTYWVIRPNQADSAITPAIGVPNNPSYPANLAATASAAATVLGALFPEKRPRLDAAAKEAALSRIFSGIHYRFDTTAGARLGRRVGRYVLEHDVEEDEPFVLN
jgi:hypothetical protein